jgi:hypothetical protein
MNKATGRSIKNDMVTRKTWNEFRDTGLLMFVNIFLHIFGWALVFTIVNEKVTGIFPARVKYRGFDEKTESENYAKLSRYMEENGEQLNEEANS